MSGARALWQTLTNRWKAIATCRSDELDRGAVSNGAPRGSEDKRTACAPPPLPSHQHGKTWDTCAVPETRIGS